jgi:hypothetical protein
MNMVDLKMWVESTDGLYRNKISVFARLSHTHTHTHTHMHKFRGKSIIKVVKKHRIDNSYKTYVVSLNERKKWTLTLWKRVILEKLMVAQLVKNSPPFYGTRKFITVFIRARHLTLSWATGSQFRSSKPFNISFPHKPRSPKCSLPFRFYD